MVVALLLGWWLEAPPFARLRWSMGGLAAGIAATAPLLVGLWWCLRTGWPPVARLVDTVEERVAPLLAGARPLELALVALLAGLGEEALFRGVLQEVLARPVEALVLGDLRRGARLDAVEEIHGALHWLSTSYAILAALVGAYLGGLYVLTDNLLAPIVTHALYDVVALSLLRRTGRGG